MKRKIMENRGITLIALVITIIVLLILAGVTIAMLIGNNSIINRSTEAKIMTNLSKVDEAIKLYKSNKKIEKVVDEENNEEVTNDDLINEENPVLKEYVIEETLRPIAVVINYDKLGIKDKFGEGYKNINEYEIIGENTPYIATLSELNNVCAIDLTDGTLYYLENGNVWSIEGKTDIVNNYNRVEAQEGEWEFDATTKTLTAYLGDLTTVRGKQQAGEVIVPNYYEGTRVSAIGNSSNAIFKDNTNLTNLTISNGIKIIGREVFAGCSSLTGDLIIPDSVTEIGWSAFSGCSSLDGTLKMSNSIVTIGEFAFFNCSNLKGNLVIPETTTTIGGSAFYKCQNLSGLTIEEGCTASLQDTGNKDYGVFSQCTGLKGTLTIPSTFGEIGGKAFYNCYGLEGIEIKSTKIKTIGEQAFYNCTGLKGDLIIPDSVTTIGTGAFYECTALDGNLKMSNQVEKIGSFAFYNCTGLKGDLIIPNTTTSIGASAFYKCQSMNSLTIEEGCTASLPLTGNGHQGVFSQCTGLKGTLTIPSTFGDIGAFAFYNCSGLDKIIFKNSSINIYDSTDTINSTIIISGYSGSTAEEYATNYNRTFEVIE